MIPRLLLLLVLFLIPELLLAVHQDRDRLQVNFQDLCWSPDGTYLYFSAMKVKGDYSDYKPEKWGVYRYSFTAKRAERFVDSAMYVAVSPSGRQVAVGKIAAGNRDIYIADNDGKNLRRITSHPAEEFGASWSPDETRIVFNSKRDGKPEVYVVNVDTTGLKRLTFSEGSSSYNPAWSPDGKRIAYYLEKGDRKDQIYVMNSDGSSVTNLTQDTLNNFFPDWIDNNTIVYTQDRPGAPKAFTVTVEGKTKKPFHDIESFYTRPSPDGSMIAFVNIKEQCIEVISATGSAITKIFMP